MGLCLWSDMQKPKAAMAKCIRTRTNTEKLSHMTCIHMHSLLILANSMNTLDPRLGSTYVRSMKWDGERMDA